MTIDHADPHQPYNFWGVAFFEPSQLCKHLFSWKILLLRGNQLVFPPARHSGHFPSELHHPALQERLRWGHGVSYETIGKWGCIHKLPAIDCLKSRGPAGTDLVAAFKDFYLLAALKWEAHFAWLETSFPSLLWIMEPSSILSFCIWQSIPWKAAMNPIRHVGKVKVFTNHSWHFFCSIKVYHIPLNSISTPHIPQYCILFLL